MTKKNQNRIKKVILHIGSGKTGSTSIQYSLKKSQDLLLRNGILYPSDSLHRVNQAILGSCFTAAADLLRYNLHRDNLQELLERDRDYLSSLEKLLLETQAHTTIFSYEGFCHLTEDALNKMKTFFEKYCAEIQIVFYVRPPLSYAKSAMSQRVKTGRRAFVDDDNFPFINHQDILEKICRVFEKNQIDIRLFSKETLPGGNVILDFLSLLNLPKHVADKVLRRGASRNSSLSQEALAVGDRMAELLDGYIPRGEFNNKRAIGLAFLPAIKGQKIQLTDSQQKTILELTAPHTAYLAKEFNITFKEYPHTGHTPLRISKDTVDYTARALLKLLVPEFSQPTEPPAPSGHNLDRAFIFRVMLKTRIIAMILPTYRRFRPMRPRLRQKTANT